MEVLLGTKIIEELIIKGEFDGIKEIMEKSETLGMQTFDSALFKLFKEGRISMDEAIKNADSANNVRLKIKLDQSENNLGKADAAAAADPTASTRTASGFTLSLQSLEEKKDDDKHKK